MPFSLRHLALLCLPALLFLCACSTPYSLRHLPVAQIHHPITSQKYGGELPKTLNDYVEQWNKWLSEAPPPSTNLAVKTALPPTASQLFFSPQYYTDTFPLLLETMSLEGLNTAQRNFLQTLALLHQQQAILANIYEAVNNLQHARREAISEMLTQTRRLQNFEKNFQQHLRGNDARLVLEELKDWLALWDGLTPLDVLPTLWQATLEEGFPASPTDDAPQPSIAVRFTALYEERPAYQKLPDELQNASHLWIRQDFATPVVAPGRIAYLILPAMHQEALFHLNGTPLENPCPGQPWAIPLTTELTGEAPTQHISIRIPTHALGNPILPICLAAGYL